MPELNAVEPPYAFRRHLETVHHRDQRDPNATPESGEVTIDGTWRIVVAHDAEDLIRDVARDLQDYFAVSMEIDLLLERVEDLATFVEPAIVLVTAPGDGVPEIPRSYRLTVTSNRIVIAGHDDRGTA